MPRCDWYKYARQSSPGGTTELSPALQRWERWKEKLKSRRDDRGLTLFEGLGIDPRLFPLQAPGYLTTGPLSAELKPGGYNGEMRNGEETAH